MTDQSETTPELPAVGSVWKALDGRIMRVEEWTRPTFYPADHYWARVTVLNPSKGMRKQTTQSLPAFGRFLQEHSHD